MAGDEIEDRGAAAAIDHVGDLDVLLCRHIFGHHVADRTDARRDVFEAILLLAHEREQFLERLRRRRAVHREHIGRPAQIGDVGEIAHRVETRILVHGGREHVRGHAGDDERVAVGLGTRHRLGADETAAAGAVLDEELLAEHRAELLAEHAPQEVVRAAGRVGHDHPHRLGGPVGGRGGGRHRDVEGDQRGKQSLHACLPGTATPPGGKRRPGGTIPFRAPSPLRRCRLARRARRHRGLRARPEGRRRNSRDRRWR